MKKFLLLLALPAVTVMIPSLVSADGTTERPTPSSSQIACMAEQGFTRPATKPTVRPTREQQEKMKAAARACGLSKKSSNAKPGAKAVLNSAQIACMAEQGFTRPATKTTVRTTREQQEKMKAAAVLCGVSKAQKRS